MTLPPESGRQSTIMEALGMLDGAAFIVEVGTARNTIPAAMESDGWATRLWAWYVARRGGRCVSIDPSERAIAAARILCDPWPDTVEWHRERAESIVADLPPIDLLYMDGPPDAQTHYAIYRQLRDPPRMVLFDDIIDREYRVKGELAIPAMLREGYTLAFNRDRQALLMQEAIPRLADDDDLS